MLNFKKLSFVILIIFTVTISCLLEISEVKNKQNSRGLMETIRGDKNDKNKEAPVFDPQYSNPIPLMGVGLFEGVITRLNAESNPDLISGTIGGNGLPSWANESKPTVLQGSNALANLK